MRYRSGHRRRSEGCGIKTKGGGKKKLNVTNRNVKISV